MERRKNMKKLTVLFILVLALIAGGLVSCVDVSERGALDGGAESRAAAIFTIDVNPGVKVYLDSSDKVFLVEATNLDGREIVKTLSVVGLSYAEAIERIIDAYEASGYIDGASSVLLSIEKKSKDITADIEKKVNDAFAKHTDRVAIIKQELGKLDGKIKVELERISDGYDISKGKAHLILKIREELPELPEEELARLSVEELRAILEETSEDVKGHFELIGEAIKDAYISKEEAIERALSEVSASLEEIERLHTHLTVEDGKLVFDIEFVFGELEFEFEIDAVSGEVIESEFSPYEEFDYDKIVNDFLDYHDIDIDFNGGVHHVRERMSDRFLAGAEVDRILTKAEVVARVLDEIKVYEGGIEEIEVELVESVGAGVYAVSVEMRWGDEYRIVLDAHTGVLMSLEVSFAEAGSIR